MSVRSKSHSSLVVAAANKVKIVEEYYNYFPPVRVYGSLQVLLRYVPEQHLVGLHKITLTNSEYLQKTFKGKYTYEKGRIRAADTLGFYYDGQIRLVMDQILQQYPETLLLIPLFKNVFLGEVLYHEIGHHIHRMEQPGFRDRREATADEWEEKLIRKFMRERYWYLAGIGKLLSPLLRRIKSKTDSAGLVCKMKSK